MSKKKQKFEKKEDVIEDTIDITTEEEEDSDKDVDTEGMADGILNHMNDLEIRIKKLEKVVYKKQETFNQ